MYVYDTSLAITGTVQRPTAISFDKGIQRTRLLDSLVMSRLHQLHQRPELLLYTSADGQRPSCSQLFGRTTVLNSLSDLWNAVIKEPRTAACFAQIVDESPLGHNEVARSALELSLLKVKPFDLASFEHLLEVQEHVYPVKFFDQLMIDPLQRFIALDAQRRRPRESQAIRDNQKKPLLLLEGCIHPISSLEVANKSFIPAQLRGRDCYLGDFRKGLQGIADLFRQWDQWLGERGKHAASFQAIYIYAQIKGLLPACWEELRARGVAADQLRLPQWASYANALSSYWEFLLSPHPSAALLYIPMNGRCHFSERVNSQ